MNQQEMSPAEEAREIMHQLGKAAAEAGIRLPSPRLDPTPIGEAGATAHLIDLGKVNLTAARTMTKVFEAARK